MKKENEAITFLAELPQAQVRAALSRLERMQEDTEYRISEVREEIDRYQNILEELEDEERDTAEQREEAQKKLENIANDTEHGERQYTMLSKDKRIREIAVKDGNLYIYTEPLTADIFTGYEKDDKRHIELGAFSFKITPGLEYRISGEYIAGRSKEHWAVSEEKLCEGSYETELYNAVQRHDIYALVCSLFDALTSPLDGSAYMRAMHWHLIRVPKSAFEGKKNFREGDRVRFIGFAYDMAILHGETGVLETGGGSSCRVLFDRPFNDGSREWVVPKYYLEHYAGEPVPENDETVRFFFDGVAFFANSQNQKAQQLKEHTEKLPENEDEEEEDETDEEVGW